MPLVADTPSRIGPFVVDRELARGGMGVVYLGRDPRLDRPVAIKGIAADLLSDPLQVARLQREARLLAQLSHPNIVTIFSIEEEAGSRFLVMEYIEGPDLAERLAAPPGGPLPVREALPVCLHVARALQAAHDAGVIHRDLKPSNVKIGPGGRVKVLDFGLARGTPQEPNPDADTVSVVVRTSHGAILGTPGYMSPEQARSEPADKRTDIFSFGCLLYECLTGERAFWGKSVADAIAATLTKEPDLAKIPSDVPQAVREVVAACLQKEVENRLGSIGVAADALEEAMMSQKAIAVAPAAMMESRGMPRLHTSLIGRTGDLGTLLALIKKSPLVAITAPGGVGKTRLVQRLASDLESRGLIRSAYVDLAVVSDPSQLTHAVASSFGLGRAESPDDLGELLARLHLPTAGKPKDLLVVLDDWEALGEPCKAPVRQALAEGTKARIVLTGREPTGIQGEEVFRLAALAVPPEPLPASESELRSFDAFRLFLERIPEREPPFELTLHNRAEIAKIVRRLGGVPLAIEIAAARVHLVSPERILRGLEDQLRPIAAESGGTVPRGAIVRAAARWSYSLLSPREQVFLTRISGLIGGFSVEDALRVVAQDSRAGHALGHLTLRDAADALDALVNKALVCLDAGPHAEPCYGVHHAVRLVALKQAGMPTAE